MQINRLRSMLDSADEAKAWLTPLGITDPHTAHANLLRLAESGLPLDLLGTICDQFASVAPQLADPDMALNCLERFLLSARSPMSTAALFERDVMSLPHLLRLFNTSQTLSDLLCTDPESYDLLRTTEGRPVARDMLVEELVSDIRILESDDMVLAALRRFKRRETLRIAFGDIIGEQPVSQIARQISYVADAIVEAALVFAHRQIAKKLHRHDTNDAPRPRFVVLALGKLGGLELNYSSDIDLLLIYQSTNGKSAAGTSANAEIENQEYCNRVSRELIRLLTETTDQGFAYRVDMRLRPEGKHGPICSSFDSALTYYDVRGRTWERQAYVKARAIAGDIDLGREYLSKLEPWIYRRYLSLADITGIKALKRRIEARAEDKGVSDRNVKTGHGGIRDIEFVIQFLQLLSGGTLPKVRSGNTLDAIVLLEQNGCLMRQERSILEENYSYLRKLEHRLQIMFDLQTHQLPTDESELTKLARRMGHVADHGPGTPHVSALAAFQKDYSQRTQLNRKILDHLLHDAFGEDAKTEPEVDLVNDPDPPQQFIERVLKKHAFQDIQAAYSNLMSLAEERIPFLSTRRCRFFLASIAPRLLDAISKTPDPDATLVSLSRVSDSLGGKAALWELLSSNHPTLNLYVTLCAACPYLAGILTSNPGMIDELLDSLIVEKLPNLQILEASLADLTRGAEDIEPILHSFKHAQHLRVGVRDILGKDDIRATHRVLSDIAEVCFKQIVRVEQQKLVQKLGQPMIGPLSNRDSSDGAACDGADCDRAASPWRPHENQVGQPCELIVLAMGKLGGREPNYHSDLDLVFLYEAEGDTQASRPLGDRLRLRKGTTTNNHFFSELGQRIIKKMNHFGPQGQLYEVDPRLRPTGRSGSLAVPIAEFVHYFQEGRGQLWERQALCKARVIIGSPQVAERTMAAVAEVAYGPCWQPENNAQIWDMRMKLQKASTPRNLKKGSGGTMDTEFIVQTLQLKHGRDLPHVRVTGTLAAIEALEKADCLDSPDAEFLNNSYRFQRKVEAGIRLMDSTGRHDFPENPKDLAKLAYLLGYAEGSELAGEVQTMFYETRAVFERIFEQAQPV